MLARNEGTNEQGYFTVTATHQTYRDHTLAVVLRVDGREETIETTSDHPFYDVREGFVEASKLVAGDWLALADGGYASVLRLETRVVGQFVYNLTVDQAHTYFVGDAGVWVHNCGLKDLARFRADLGLKSGEGTLARLDVNGKSFYGINAHGQKVTMPVNAISKTHAEADAFQQALNAGAKGGNANLYVDRALCLACGQNGGVRTMARQLGLDQLNVITPHGIQIIRP